MMLLNMILSFFIRRANVELCGIHARGCLRLEHAGITGKLSSALGVGECLESQVARASPLAGIHRLQMSFGATFAFTLPHLFCRDRRARLRCVRRTVELSSS